MAQTTVHQGQNDQYKTTIPKDLADALDLDGETLEWSIGSSISTLEAKVVDDE